MPISLGLQNLTDTLLSIGDSGLVLEPSVTTDLTGVRTPEELISSVDLFSAVQNDQVLIFYGVSLLSKENSLAFLSGRPLSEISGTIIKFKDPLTGEVRDLHKTEHPVAGDGKPRVLSSHKPIIKGKEAYNFFTSCGDNNYSKTLASGTALKIETANGVPSSAVDLHFSAEVNPLEVLYIFGGGISWENAGWGDSVSLEIRALPTNILPRATSEGLGLSVNYSLDGDRIYYAGANQGDYALGGYPVWVPNFTNRGYWDLDKIKLAAIPNVSGTGTFDWYRTEQQVGYYAQNLLVYGTNYQPVIIDGTESAPLPYGHFFRFVADNQSNTAWRAWGFLKMYRERLK